MSANYEDYFWCSFEARQSASIIIEEIALFAQLFIFVMLIYARIKAQRQQQFHQISIIYKLIVSWLICFFLKTLVNIVAYLNYISKSSANISSGPEEINFFVLRIMSAVFILLDCLTSFFLQISIIYIPYLWTRNALELLLQSDLKVEDRIKISRISRFLNLMKKYLVFRNIYVVYFLTIAIIVIAFDSFKGSKYIAIVSTLESIAILIIYPMGLWTWTIIRKKITLNKKQERSMLIEYFTLMFCSLVRIGLNIAFNFSNLVHYEPDKYCYDNHDLNQTRFNCLFLGFGLFLMHIVPGTMILYIYWPSKNNRTDLKNSILMSATDTGID